MSYKLDKPFTEDEKLNFIVNYNHSQGLNIKESDTALYALEVNELWNEQRQEPYIDPEYEEKQKEKEAERIGNLKCTKRVLVLMLQELQYSWKNTIKPLIYANDDAALEWELCVELERKNPLLNQLGGQLGISSEQIDNLFKYANGEITQQEFLGE